MAARRKAHNGPDHKRWYSHCPNCKSEQETVMGVVVSKKSYKAPYCRGCNQFLPVTTPRVKR